jgi:hypothetical protein|mmetsp:Transcript_9081/g.1343  ORF Transcript_9081/g.1343 Transcript_9081/m.1343 type:complete len:91 (+) Transcript_9081:738-1010(+)
MNPDTDTLYFDLVYEGADAENPHNINIDTGATVDADDWYEVGITSLKDTVSAPNKRVTKLYMNGLEITSDDELTYMDFNDYKEKYYFLIG